MKGLLALVLIVSILLIPSNALAGDDINFHDAITKHYNDNGFPKLKPESPLILTTTFSVDSKLSIYFNIEESDDNLPFFDPANYKMRIILRNDTWSFTDLGEFGDGADLTAPTLPHTVVPGFNYTVEMQIRFTEALVNINDTFEFSVVIGVQTGGGFNPSDSITHLVQFSEEPPPPLPPITTRTGENFHFLWVIAIVAMVIFTAYAIIYKRSLKKEDEDET